MNVWVAVLNINENPQAKITIYKKCEVVTSEEPSMEDVFNWMIKIDMNSESHTKLIHADSLMKSYCLINNG